jgi:hypothetical protein
MRIRCIACEALARVVYHCAARSPHMVDVELMRIGLHNDPSDLRRKLQERIDEASRDGGYDAVALAYGLCGKATAGITAIGIPLVIPRAHDCITLFLGSRDTYQRQFEQCAGTYWYAADYIERGGQSTGALSLGNATAQQARKTWEEFVATYGEENAAYLMEAMGAWGRHYSRAVYIDMGIAQTPAVEKVAQEESQRRGWSFEKLAGDTILLRRLLDGTWDADFLVLRPGQRLRESFDSGVVAPGD